MRQELLDMFVKRHTLRVEGHLKGDFMIFQTIPDPGHSPKSLLKTWVDFVTKGFCVYKKLEQNNILLSQRW